MRRCAELADAGRFEFAIVSDSSSSSDAPDAEAVTRATEEPAHRPVRTADGSGALAASVMTHLLALALAPCEQLDDGRVAWRYDIDRYNPERPWNSPEDWANPENFERFRW
jgi:hypothetical protein